MSQFRREMEELSNEYLFKSYSPVGYDHVVERHMDISVKGLKKRLAPMPFDIDGEIKSMSRFYEGTNMAAICEMIYKCVCANEKEIREYLASSMGVKARDFYVDLHTPIGEGIVKGTDETTLFQMSRICVVVGHANKNGRMLEVYSAYPVLDCDEIDEAYDAIVEWQSHK